MKEVVIAGIFTIVGGGIGWIATYSTALVMYRKQSFEKAAMKFRRTVLDNLGDIIEPEDEDSRPVGIGKPVIIFVDIIHVAALEFKFFVERKEEFNKAVKYFKNFAKAHETYERCWWRDSSKNDFDDIINNLLSFTVKKSFADNLRDKLARLPDMIKKMKQCKF